MEILETLRHRVKQLWSQITIEPVFLLFSLNFGFYIFVSKDLYIQKVCKVNLNFTDDICDNIQEHKSEQIQVQKYVSTLQMYNSVLQALPGCGFALFAGPWSDRHGRKFLIIFSAMGYVISNAVFIINTYFSELPAEYLLFESIQDLTGGGTVFFLASYSYISDVSDAESRTRRMAFLDGMFPIGFYAGNSLSGIVRKNLGFMYNFSFAMVFTVMAVLYCIFFVRDSRVLRDKRLTKELEEKMKEVDKSDKEEHERLQLELDSLKGNQNQTQERQSCGYYLKDFFKMKNITESFQALSKKRQHYKRAIIIFMILTFLLESFATQGKYTCLYLYLRRQLDFDIVQYSTYITALGGVGLFGQWVAVPFLTKKLGFQDYTVAIIGENIFFFETLMKH